MDEPPLHVGQVGRALVAHLAGQGKAVRVVSLHRPSAAVSLLAGNPTAFACSLAWGSHQLWDRGVGYNLRNADGSIKNGEVRSHAEFAGGSR